MPMQSDGWAYKRPFGWMQSGNCIMRYEYIQLSTSSTEYFIFCWGAAGSTNLNDVVNRLLRILNGYKYWSTTQAWTRWAWTTKVHVGKASPTASRSFAVYFSYSVELEPRLWTLHMRYALAYFRHWSDMMPLWSRIEMVIIATSWQYWHRLKHPLLLYLWRRT